MPWHNDEDCDDITFFFDRVMGEKSGFKLVEINLGNDMDYYLASTEFCFESHDWKPVTITKGFDPVAMKKLDASFAIAAQKLGLASKKPSIILVSEGYES